MKSTVGDVIALLEDFVPSTLAEEWDNVGLQVGQASWPVTKIWIALDPTYMVMSAACSQAVDLLITHHPLIFRPLTSVDFSTPTGAIIKLAAAHKTALFAMHTNFDKTAGGLNDLLAEKIGLQNIRVWNESVRKDVSSFATSDGMAGMARIGELAHCIDLDTFVVNIKEALGILNVRAAGDQNLNVSRVAVCTGSGSGLFSDFLQTGAEVFVSGDFRYHDARTAEELGLGLVDIGHFASEHIFIDLLLMQLKKLLAAQSMEIQVEGYRLEDDPFRIV